MASVNEPTTSSTNVAYPSARIRDLNEIDAEISHLLRSAGLAIDALTANTSSETRDKDIPENEEPKAAFEHNTQAFLNTVQAISARLRRQAYALEEAGITAAEPSSADTQQSSVRNAASTMQVTNGGLGNLDVGWLNSRRDNVGKQKEVELWKQAKETLEQWKRGENEETNGDGDSAMQNGED